MLVDCLKIDHRMHLASRQPNLTTPLSSGRGQGRLLWIGAFCLLFLLLRWDSYNAPLVRDEGEFAYAAQLLAHGIKPYEHAFLQKPPMTVYEYALASAIAPGLFWAPRLLAYLFTALATGILGWMAWAEFGCECAITVVGLATPMFLLPGLVQAGAVAETFMLLPLLGVVGLYIRSRHRPADVWVWAAAGSLSAVVLLHKYTALPVVAAVFACWIVEERSRDCSFTALWWRSFVAAGGAALAGIVCLLPFLSSDGGKHLWECTVAFNRSYVASTTFGMARFWAKVQFFWQHWQALFLLPLALLFRRPAERPYRWVVMLLASVVSTGASYYLQYYLLLIPFWAMLAGLGLKQLSSWLAERLGRPQWIISRTLAGILVGLLCLPRLIAVLSSGPLSSDRTFNPINPFPESLPVAARVAALTSPVDFVLIAGSEPQILVYAQRFSPTRFVIAYPLMFPSPLAESFHQEAIQQVERHPPAVIVKARSNTSWLKQTNSLSRFPDYLDELLAQSYERLGGYVLGAASGAWREPLPDTDFFNASLVLYRRKPVQSAADRAAGQPKQEPPRTAKLGPAIPHQEAFPPSLQRGASRELFEN
jgi:hypothetical protein